MLLFQRVRLARQEDLDLRLLLRPRYAAQAANLWLFVALLGLASLPGTFALYELVAPDSRRLVVLAFWSGLGITALLALVPRLRVSLAANLLVALCSVFLAAQLVRLERGPENATAIDFPLEGAWFVASGGRSALVNRHHPQRAQRHAIDLVQVVESRTHRGGADLLENFYAFNERVTAPADGVVTDAVDSLPDLPVGDTKLEHPEGNAVVIDIGGGRYVLFAHLKRGSVRVAVGDRVVSGQVIGLASDSRNSDEPHVHVQVQNRPTSNLAADDLETYPILFRDTVVIRDGFAHAPTYADVRRGDTIG